MHHPFFVRTDRYYPMSRGITCIRFLLLMVVLLCGKAGAQERIVSLAPHITELLFAVGAGDQIVATVEFSDYPEAALDIPRIGNSDRLNYETILHMSPTLVLGWESGNGSDSLDRLRELGLNVHTHNPQSLEDVADSLRVFGLLSGNELAGADQSNQFLIRLRDLEELYSEKQPVRLFYQLWDEPLMTINGEHLISDVIRLCGGENVFSEAVPLIPKMSKESVIRLNPDVIIRAQPSGESSEMANSWKQSWNEWSSVVAVRESQLFSIHSDLMHRHSPRILDGAAQVCEILASVR